jgi:tetratricopeptide (TPR) repeat protein
LLIGVSAVAAQQQASIQGAIRDPAGNPVRGASVRLENSGALVAEATSNADGAFAFETLGPGDYSVSAEKAGRRAAAVTVHVGTSKSEHVDLILRGSDSTPQSAPASPPMEFADQPNFTIAAVTDWTAAGGHGSDAVLRTSEALNREAINLKPGATGERRKETTGEWKQRETALRAAVDRAPEKFETNHELGEFYLQSARYAEATQPLETASKIEPDNFDNGYDLALALKASGDFAHAGEQADRLLTRHDSADVHRLKAEIDEGLRDPLAAVHEFERAVRRDPSEQNYFEWGSELLLHRAVWQAKDVFTAGVKAYPKSERMLTALGAALFAGARYDEAAQRLCEAADLNPGDPQPYIFLGKVEVSSPDPLPCVEQQLAKFLALRPQDPLANYYYAMTMWKQKEHAADPATLERVRDLLAKAVKVDPKCSDAYLQLGVLQATRQDFQKAIEFYRKAIEAEPQMSEAHYRLGVAYDRIGDKKNAAEQFRLHDEIEKSKAAEVEKQRREVKQFVVVVDGNKSGATPQ